MKNKILPILTLLIAALCIYIFIVYFESYEDIEDLGWDKKALRNPYLAAEQFLIKQGLNVTSANNFDKLDKLPEEGLIFISDTGKSLSQNRIDKLLDWVAQGGHLIVTAPLYNKNHPSPLLSKFKVENHELPRNEVDDEEITPKKISEQLIELNEELNNKSNSTKENKDNAISEDKITTITFTDIDQSLKLKFTAQSTLRHPYLTRDDNYVETDTDPIYWSGDDYSTHFMQFNVEQGYLSVLTDNTIWQSKNIDLLDHAHLLWLFSEGSSEIIILYGANVPSIFDYIWRYAFEVIFACCLCLSAWLAYRAKRFGKIHHLAKSGSRSIAEHIDASAAFLWHNKHFSQLLTPVRKQLIDEINRVHFSFSSLSQTEKTNFISNHCNINNKHVKTALFMPFDGDEAEFISIITYLQKIRSAL